MYGFEMALEGGCTCRILFRAEGEGRQADTGLLGFGSLVFRVQGVGF